MSVKGVVLNLFLYAAIVAGVMYGLPAVLSWWLDTPYPMASITSGSMWPVLEEGDLILIRGADRDDIAEGDIVVYQNPANRTFTIHRVVELRDDEFITKGDANFENDTPVAYRDLVGKALAIGDAPVRVPFLGSITVIAHDIRTSNAQP